MFFVACLSFVFDVGKPLPKRVGRIWHWAPETQFRSTLFEVASVVGLFVKVLLERAAIECNVGQCMCLPLCLYRVNNGRAAGLTVRPHLRHCGVIRSCLRTAFGGRVRARMRAVVASDFSQPTPLFDVVLR